jgi:membrane fusion protein
MPMALFRSESEQARANAWLGRILLLRPLSFTLLTAAAIAVALALAALFIWGEYTRKARVSGVLAPRHGVTRVLAQQGGVVRQLHAREGARVEQGEALAALVDARAGTSMEALAGSVRRQLEERRHALGLQRRHAVEALLSEQAGLEHRRAALDRELAQLETEIDIHSRRLGLAQSAASRWVKLEASGFISTAAADREREAAFDVESRLEASRRSRLALARERSAVEIEARTLKARGEAQVAAIDAQAAALDQERVEREVQHHLAVLSPVRGTVGTVLVEPGQMVVAGAPLATILPDGAPLEAHLFAPSRSIGFLRVGQDVLLRYMAYPHQKFGSHAGRVAAIARSPLAASDLGFVPPDGSREPLYRIKVELAAQSVPAYGREEPLQPGMQVEADLLLDRRSLIEWVFEPLLSLAGRA